MISVGVALVVFMVLYVAFLVHWVGHAHFDPGDSADDFELWEGEVRNG